MGDIYKVTKADVGTTKNGFQIYNIQLNNSILATKLFPLRELDKRFSNLYKYYIENGSSLDFLVGKFISISLNQTRYGVEIGSIESFDAIKDFKELLDRHIGKAFCTSINMYEFLKFRKYPVNIDGSIKLKEPYANFNIKSNNICYPNNLGIDFLLLENIELIYNQFYKDKVIENRDPDCSEKYALTSVAIIRSRTKYHKYKSKIISNHSFDVQRVGDILTKEQKDYLVNR